MDGRGTAQELTLHERSKCILLVYMGLLSLTIGLRANDRGGGHVRAVSDS